MKKLLYVLIFLLLLVMIIPINTYAKNNDYVIDEADLLTDEEEEKLQNQLSEISARQKLDVVVLTNYSTEGKEPKLFAVDYFDDHDYGYGSDHDGIILMISMENRDWALGTTGYGITAFTDYGQNVMSNKFVPKLSSGNYYGAFKLYGELCDRFITQARTGKPYDVDHPFKNAINWFVVGILVTVSFLIGLISASIMASSAKSKLISSRDKYDAVGYAVSHSVNTENENRHGAVNGINPAAMAAGMLLGAILFSAKQDHFTHTTTTRTLIPRDRGGGGFSGGSSTFTGSSGRTHGGSSGHF